MSKPKGFSLGTASNFPQLITLTEELLDDGTIKRALAETFHTEAWIRLPTEPPTFTILKMLADGKIKFGTVKETAYTGLLVHSTLQAAPKRFKD